ncbi:MAG TPA: DUF58 domain-containing protein [Phycisphaerae bacterium]|nr:DUF58 domain-containing protein [Phycisphaerae bacterium]HUU21210.1 DUF58 domain-containing protein [Phycisphaerae bacterium]
MADRELFDDEFLRRLQRLGMLAKRMAPAPSAGGHRRGRRLGDGLEFADHRAYAPGDDIRFLDWPYYARMERLLLRLFHEHSEGAVSLLLDASASMSAGQVRKFDYARRTAAALSYVAMVSLDRVQVLPFAESLGEGIRTGRNSGQILRVLDFLSPLPCGGRTRLDVAVDQFLRRGGHAGTVIVLTDAMDLGEDLSPALAALRRHGDEVILLHVADPFDASPPVAGPVQLEGLEAGERLTVHVTDAVLAEYRRQWDRFAAAVERTCLARGTVYVRAPTSAPFEKLVLLTLQRAGMAQR